MRTLTALSNNILLKFLEMKGDRELCTAAVAQIALEMVNDEEFVLWYVKEAVTRYSFIKGKSNCIWDFIPKDMQQNERVRAAYGW